MTQKKDMLSRVDDWLLGALTDDELTEFEAALAHDQDLQEAVALAEEALAATWIAMSEPVAPAPSLFERISASIQPTSSGVMGFASTLAQLLTITTEHASNLLKLLQDPDEWLPGPGPGTHLVHIDGVPLSSQAIVGFVKIEPGHHFPEHTHEGEEHTFVLSGTLKDGDNLIHRGQHDILSKGSEHLIGAHGDEDVIYLTIAHCGIRFGEFFIGPGDPEV